jgi:hypothetical protein
MPKSIVTIAPIGGSLDKPLSEPEPQNQASKTVLALAVGILAAFLFKKRIATSKVSRRRIRL